MSPVVAPDWAEFQPPFTIKLRGRRILIFRVAFGAHYQDPHFLANAAAARWLHAHGYIDGAILYQVWLKTATPAQHFAFARSLIGPTPPVWLIGVELDLETWRGQSYEQHGDHSPAINRLYALFAHYFRSWTACMIYGNQSDLAELAPHRDSRAPVNVAAYGSRLIIRSVKGAIAQQYTDGTDRWGPTPSIGGKRLPRATAGVASDHNVFQPSRFPTGRSVREFMRPRAVPTPAPAPAPVSTVVGRTPDGKSELRFTDGGTLSISGVGARNL